jgi:hypothetical protein
MAIADPTTTFQLATVCEEALTLNCSEPIRSYCASERSLGVG